MTDIKPIQYSPDDIKINEICASSGVPASFLVMAKSCVAMMAELNAEMEADERYRVEMYRTYASERET